MIKDSSDPLAGSTRNSARGVSGSLFPSLLIEAEESLPSLRLLRLIRGVYPVCVGSASGSSRDSADASGNRCSGVIQDRRFALKMVLDSGSITNDDDPVQRIGLVLTKHEQSESKCLSRFES